MTDATLVYDDDCGFCTWWADFFAARSEMRTVGFSELTDADRERLPDDYETCSHLLVGDETYSCGASLEQALVRSEPGDSVEPLVGFLRNFEDYERLREAGYRAVADRRGDLGRILSKPPRANRSE